jgi:hypothetical protein
MCVFEQHGLVQADATYQHNYHDTTSTMMTTITTPEATNLSLYVRVGKKMKGSQSQTQTSEMLYIIISVEFH